VARGLSGEKAGVRLLKIWAGSSKIMTRVLCK